MKASFLHLLVLVLILMAQCNRCNAPLANATSRSLKNHRAHCINDKPMKYRVREKSARISGKVVAQVSKLRRSFSCVTYVNYTSRYVFERQLMDLQKMKSSNSIHLDMDVDVAPEETLVENTSVCIISIILCMNLKLWCRITPTISISTPVMSLRVQTRIYPILIK
jgi:hypothetical protein